MIRVKLDSLGYAQEGSLFYTEVWKWNGAGWNVLIPMEEEIVRAEEEQIVAIPAEPGLYRIDYSNKMWETLSLIEQDESEGVKTEGLHPAPYMLKEGLLWGYINDDGKTVIDPRFEYAEEFQENGLAIVQNRGLSGLIDRSGREQVRTVYSFIAPFSEGRAVVSDSKGYFLIDEKGKTVTTKRYDFLNSLQEDRALFYTGASSGDIRYGYLNSHGKEIIPAGYEDAGDFQNGKALVKIRSGEFALIDLEGDIIQTYSYPYVGNPGDGLLAYQAVENGKYGYLYADGSVAIEPQFSSALPFSGGRAIVNTAEDYGNRYGLIDQQGRMVIPAAYYEVLQLGEQRVALGTPIYPEQPYRGSSYVIADEVSGRIISNHPLLGVHNYSKGMASVYDAMGTYFIDREGRMVSSFPVIPGSGMLSFSGNLIRASIDQRTAYYNRLGKQVWSQNAVIPLRPPYSVLEKKFKPNMNILIYYPEVVGIANVEVSRRVNDKLRILSLADSDVIDTDSQEFSYTGDFSVAFYRKYLLVLELSGYKFPFGAAHGMPSRVYVHLNLRNGRFFELGDLFKPGSKYVKKLSEIVGQQIANDPQYSYVFPDTYTGISADQPFYVDSEALYLYFAPYEIAPYAAGFPTFRIPYAEIMGLISTEGEFWQSFH